VLRIDDYFDKSRDLLKAEKRMLKDITEVMLDCDAWLGHFSTHYDLPFINSRLLYHQLPILPPNFTALDTWKISRNRLKLRNNRLATIQEFLKLPDEKNSIQSEHWLKALGGDRKAIDYIVEHNRRDVLVLEQAYLRLRPLVIDHPRHTFTEKEACKFCGASPSKVQRRGTRRTRCRLYERLQCQVCGGWDSGKMLEKQC
jgi:hypothetical protein